MKGYEKSQDVVACLWWIFGIMLIVGAFMFNAGNPNGIGIAAGGLSGMGMNFLFYLLINIAIDVRAMRKREEADEPKTDDSVKDVDKNSGVEV